MNHQPRSNTGDHTPHGPPLILRNDLPASFVLFLISIPLSLGIAHATGAPLMAGIISAVIGGVVVGAISGAPLQISGPGTGLVVIVAGLVAQFGWAATAAITLAAGVLQLALGLTGISRLVMSLSPAVVHGMLAGIGISIAVGQLVVVLGGTAASTVPANLALLPGELVGAHLGSVLAGAVAIAVLLLWPRVPRVSLIPAPLVAVATATALAFVLRLDVARVDLPDSHALVFPEMPRGSVGTVLTAIVTVALVASMESLLSAVATDRLHDGPRARLDKELIAQGTGNVLAGALGGFPISGGLARSSTNVAAGAKTRYAAIFQGVWIAVAVLAFAPALELIPLSALAGVLFVVGLRLVSVARMRNLVRHREFLVYAATALGVVLFGLLEGVVAGLAIALLRALYRLTHCSVRVESNRVYVRGSLVFLGVGRLVRELRKMPQGETVVLELHVDYLDHASYEAINDWREGYERLGGRVQVDEVHDTWYDRANQGKPGRHKTLPGPLPRWFAPWSHWQGTPGPVTLPEQRSSVEGDPMLRGMHEFERRSAPLVRPFLHELAVRGQRPQQLFITCADSRVVPNLITTSGPGDLFCVRNIGNLVPMPSAGDSSVGAAIEYAVEILNVSTIVVCGHSDCGAMKALVNGSASRGSHLHSWLRNAEPSLIRFHAPTAPGCTDLPVADRLAVANVAQQLDNLLAHPSVREAIAAGTLTLKGMYFDISNARVYLVDPDRNGLEPVTAPA
ncbi:SulP family inorganic anion transporter [Lentzea sp. NBC_00516]|uniref:SulP family inorganic anion transporter n=1 Tax=Lentzea sp. NBC_00516 TaxID=2903582 RepID=UPI002E7FCEA0|nr:SulP family inorganic anion transporter [Lentzea sp. NBC_00516]WUD24606.1 SulP family inorganic anion transporter [Lentzea sp. NBC_00516]